MGQFASSTATAETSQTHVTYSRDHILQFYNRKVFSEFNNLEILSFMKKLNLHSRDELLEIVSDEKIINWLYLPKDNVLLIRLILNMIRCLCNFPFINSSFNDITGLGLLKTIALVDHSKCLNYIGDKKYDHWKLLFISWCLNKNEKNQSDLDAIDTASINQNILINQYDNINMDELTLSIEYLQPLLTWLLIIWFKIPHDNTFVDYESFMELWKQFNESTLNILRTILNDNINHIDSQQITYNQFNEVISICFPNLTKPLEVIFNHLLYSDKDLVMNDIDNNNLVGNNFKPTKLMNTATFAQLTMILRTQNFPITKLQKLYIGRENGFSIRSFQNKVFKWAAPTILLISGMRIQDDHDFATVKNPRYKTFLQDYNKLKDSDQKFNSIQLKKRKIILAVCIAEPWRVTNKYYFGSDKTLIVQLSPTIEIYKSKLRANVSKVNNDVKDNGVVYFNTLGGGIGIGNDQPTINSKKRQYNPGNISLSIDNSLEFGSFRNCGLGGTFQPGLLDEKREDINQSYEIRFLIQDIEIWGCGGIKELDEQLRQLQWEENESRRRQQVNLKSLSEDRALLEMVGLVGQHQSGGSI